MRIVLDVEAKSRFGCPRPEVVAEECVAQYVVDKAFGYALLEVGQRIGSVVAALEVGVFVGVLVVETPIGIADGEGGRCH